MPIVGIYDRWEEEADSRYLVDGKAVIASKDLLPLLSDDPSAEVVAKVNAHKTWQTVGQISATTALIAALVAVVGYGDDEETGKQHLSIPTINVFWGIAALSAAVAGGSYFMSERSLRDAVPVHNDHIPATAMRQGAPPLMVTWEAHF